MAEVLAREPEFRGTRFVAAEGTYAKFLEPLGVAREAVTVMPAAPIAGRYERFHGLGSTGLYRKHLRERPKLILHPELRSVLRADIPQAVFYHDLMELEQPLRFRRKWDRWLYYRYKCGVAARSAFKLANSEYTKGRVLAHFPSVDPASIRVTHLGLRGGLEPAPRGDAEPEGPLECLYVGSYEQRKNVPALLANLDAVLGDREAVLHLAGHADGETRDRLMAMGAGRRHRVVWHGLVPDRELRDLYSRCRFLLFPSLKEGFGLPLVEAMSHGLVVCAFRNSAIPEVLGDAGILSGDGDFVSWGRAIGRLLAEPGGWRAESARSTARAGYFSPARARERFKASLGEIFRAARIGG
jgi:glycosyltransferase involved in cell wall biosynthesis